LVGIDVADAGVCNLRCTLAYNIRRGRYWIASATCGASIHGLGLITAATILAEVGDPSHFTTGSQLVKLVGIHPVPNTSGSKTRSRTPMSHKGRPRLRTALYFAAMRLVQVDEDFARLYQHYRQRDENPLLKLQALGAVMNRLMRILWALMRHQTLYQPGWYSRT